MAGWPHSGVNHTLVGTKCVVTPPAGGSGAPYRSHVSTAAVLRRAAGNRPVRRVGAAYAAASTAEWALWVVVLVYVYEAAGTGAAGSAVVALVVPAALAVPFGGALADGARPALVLTAVYAVTAVAVAAAGLGAALAVPYPVVVALAAVAVTAIAFVRPCLAVVLPAVVTTAEELTAANLLTTAAESAAVLVGPLLAAGLLASGPSSLALGACAVPAAVSAAMMLAVAALDRPAVLVATADAGPGPLPPPLPRRRTVRFPAAVRTTARDRALRALVLVLAGQAVVVGALDLVYVVVAVDDLGLGPGTPGLLAASFGVGAVVGGVGAAGFVGRRRLSPATTVALVTMGAALGVLAARASLPAALVLFPLVGLGRTVVDLTGRMLLQRCGAHDTVATTFAVVESVSLVASAAGALGARALIGVAGGRGALAGLALVAAGPALAPAAGVARGRGPRCPRGPGPGGGRPGPRQGGGVARGR